MELYWSSKSGNNFWYLCSLSESGQFGLVITDRINTMGQSSQSLQHMPNNVIITSNCVMNHDDGFSSSVCRHIKDDKTGLLSKVKVSSTSGFVLRVTNNRCTGESMRTYKQVVTHFPRMLSACSLKASWVESTFCM